jgi:hypothetical protein
MEFSAVTHLPDAVNALITANHRGMTWKEMVIHHFRQSFPPSEDGALRDVMRAHGFDVEKRVSIHGSSKSVVVCQECRRHSDAWDAGIGPPTQTGEINVRKWMERHSLTHLKSHIIKSANKIPPSPCQSQTRLPPATLIHQQKQGKNGRERWKGGGRKTDNPA